MNRITSRVRQSLYAVLRPVYYRIPLLRRTRQRYFEWKASHAEWKAGLLRQAHEEWARPDNLHALQALSQRRRDAAAAHCARPIVSAPAEWPLIDVSVVTYNSREWVAGFMASLLKQAYPTTRIQLFFVDHGSSDGTVAELEAQAAQHQARFASFTIIRQANLGFGCGHDRAIRAGQSPYCLVSNIDLEFRSDSLTTVVLTALSDTESTVASWELRQIPFEHPKYYDPVTLETNWSSHACILLRRSAYEQAGGYDRRIFMYAEDVELSYRFRSHGYVLKYVPQATVHHYTYKSAGETKPTQFSGSTLGNLYLRRRYGSQTDWQAGLLMYWHLIRQPQAFPGARWLLLKNLLSLARHRHHFTQGRGNVPVPFPFRGFDYEMRRDGAFHEARPFARATAPLVSVITRTYQGRGMFLTQALQSILNQTYPNIELVIVEDGGETQRPIVEALAARAIPGRMLRFLPNPKLGRSAAGNAGLAAATGKYMMFLDDDDLLFADHIETLARALEEAPELSAAYALSLEVLTEVWPDRSHYTETSFATPALFYQQWDHEVMQRHNFIPIQAILFKRELFEGLGGFDTELDQLEDWHLWLRYGFRKQFRLIEKTTSMFRSPANSALRSERVKKLNDAYVEAKQRALACFEAIDAAAEAASDGAQRSPALDASAEMNSRNSL